MIFFLILFITNLLFVWFFLNNVNVSGFRSNRQGSGGKGISGGNRGHRRSHSGGHRRSHSGGHRRSHSGGHRRSHSGGYRRSHSGGSRTYDSRGSGYGPYYYYLPCSDNSECPSNICLFSGVCYV